MKVKESKEVVVAKITTRQVVIVAVISFFTTVAVTSITNFDKFVNTNDGVKEEVGYYQGRASNVDRALREEAETLQAQSELAQKSGKIEEANRLKAQADEVRAENLKFLEKHNKHLEAIKNGERLVASEIKTEANEEITKLNVILEDSARLPYAVYRYRVDRKGNITTFPIHIPLYGKGSFMQGQEQICEIKKIENSGHKQSARTTPSDW